MKTGSLWHIVGPGEKAPEEVNVIIETPKGSRNKYEISKEYQGIILDRVLHSSVVYPADYGLIPQTLYDDGDPIDVLVVMSFPTYPGITLKARPIGVMHMIDSGDKDNKIVAVPVKDPAFEHVRKLDDLNPHLIKEFKNFFETYKLLEGKRTSVDGFGSKEEALAEIKESMKVYSEKYH
ncbi:MAG: inorganic diphosphatase [Thermoplasmataceae archaeon]